MVGTEECCVVRWNMRKEEKLSPRAQSIVFIDKANQALHIYYDK